MAKLRIEDVVYFLVIAQIVAVFVLGLPIFDSLFPGMRWDDNAHTLVAANASWNTTGLVFPSTNTSDSQYVNASALSGNAILDAVTLAFNFGQLMYSFITTVGLIYPIVNAMFGAAAAKMISTIWYILLGYGLIKVLSGRLSWG